MHEYKEISSYPGVPKSISGLFVPWIIFALPTRVAPVPWIKKLPYGLVQNNTNNITDMFVFLKILLVEHLVID